MNKFRIKVNDLENPSINQLKTNRSNPDLHEKSNLKILKGSNQPSIIMNIIGNVPRSFWHDLYG